MRALDIGAPSFACSLYKHALTTHHAASIAALLAVLSLSVALAASTVFNDCSERSCEAALNEAQGMILATGADAIALAERASLAMSSPNFSCCRRYPPITIRAALVRPPHPHVEKLRC